MDLVCIINTLKPLSVVKWSFEGPLGQSDAPSKYSGGHRLDPQSDHISFIQIRSRSNFYSYSLSYTDSKRGSCQFNYWEMCGHLVLVNGLRSLPRNSVDRLTDRLDMTLTVNRTIKPQNKHLGFVLAVCIEVLMR